MDLVLRVVVIRVPALPEGAIRAASVAAVEEALPIDLGALHGDTQVRQPLCREVGAHRFVEGVGVVRVGKSLDLGAGWIPGLVLGLGRDRVERRAGIASVSEVTLDALADQTTARGCACGGLRTKSVRQRFAVDGRVERVPTGAPGAAAGERPSLDAESAPVMQT